MRATTWHNAQQGKHDLAVSETRRSTSLEHCRLLKNRPVNAINTLSAVETWIAGTFVDVRGTDEIVISNRTVATERVDLINASAAVQTRARFAFVNVDLAQTA